MMKKAALGAMMKPKPKGKGLPPAGQQRPVDFEPKSKYPVTKNGGDNYDETIKLDKERKAKGIMKMGGKLKKAKAGGSFPDLNKDGKISQADVLIGKGVLPKKAKSGASMKKCKYGCH